MAQPAVATSQGLALPSKKHPKYNEHEYFLAVESAFERWEAMQNAGHLDFTSQSKMTGLKACSRSLNGIPLEEVENPKGC